MSLFPRAGARVTADEARSRTGGDQPEAVLLDVREKPEGTAGHAPGAVHVPLTGLLAGGALPTEARGRRLVVICRSGHRSRQAAELLAGRGAQAVDVEGGMNAWAAAGHPVVDERGNSGKTA
ncbi:rhodanese-like domain-containing protein [Streptomyces sp. NPDC044984]|uniref:rhodanese-like domain-containing protein n=1 Tax=Streptomyces sp. NPDC044984 TaxID=3154335 RepID=UPI0033E32D26